jgi:hypothetical protein
MEVLGRRAGSHALLTELLQTSHNRLAPEGPLTIAQRFIAGSKYEETNRFVPAGTIDNGPRNYDVNRPYGTPNMDDITILPSDESLGYYQTSLRD